MRALTLVLSAFIVILATPTTSAQVLMRAPASSGGDNNTYTCRIITGYGTAIGRGATKNKAKEKAWEICGEKMIDQYLAQRGNIPDEVVGDLTTACINKDCQ